jgi:hypothetical protein
MTNFLLGAQDRMGYNTKAQLGLQMRVITTMLSLVQEDVEELAGEGESGLVKFGALVAILTAGSLRGYEGFYLDLAATLKFLPKGRTGKMPKNFSRNSLLSDEEVDQLPSVCICLLGKFKGETGERYHSIVLANKTWSEIPVRWWVKRLMAVCREEGRSSGLAFASATGSPPCSTDYNAFFRQYLCRLQQEQPEIFSEEEDVTRYGISRTPRRSAVTRAGQAGLSTLVVESMNRWRTVESAKAARPKLMILPTYSMYYLPLATDRQTIPTATSLHRRTKPQ